METIAINGKAQNYICINCGWVIVDNETCLEFDGVNTIDKDFGCDAECPLCRVAALYPTSACAMIAGAL